MSRNGDVPGEIAPAPLPPVAGGQGEARRFGDGRVMIEVDGTEVTWSPDGAAGRAVPCRAPAR